MRWLALLAATALLLGCTETETITRVVTPTPTGPDISSEAAISAVAETICPDNLILGAVGLAALGKGDDWIVRKVDGALAGAKFTVDGTTGMVFTENEAARTLVTVISRSPSCNRAGG